MKVVEFLKTANKNYQVKASRVMQLKRYYLGMYRAGLVRLYDLNFIDDPTYLNEKNIYGDIKELGIKDMFDLSGRIRLTTDQVKFAYYKSTDKDIREFLEDLYFVLYYREECDGLDKFYTEFGFEGLNKQKVNLKLGTVNMIVTSKVFSGLSKANLECLVPFNETIVRDDGNEIIWKYAMQELNIPEEDWNKDGLFDSKLSHSQELELCKPLFEGIYAIKGGKYSLSFTQWLFDHKWSLNEKMTNQKKGLYSYIFSSHVEELYTVLSQKLNKFLNEGKHIIAIDHMSFFYSKPIKEYKIPIAAFSIACTPEGEDILFNGNLLNGASGEFYSEEYLRENNNQYVGCPIELNITPKKTKIFYDYEQTDINTDTWFESEDVNLDFDAEVDTPNISVEKPCEKALLEMYMDSNKGYMIGVLDASKFSEEDIISAKKTLMKLLK